MATTILFIACILEALLAAYCLWTQSRQEKFRSIVRISVFVVFISLTLASIIPWSFRWYALSALLITWAIFGALALFNPRAPQKEFKTRQIVFQASLALLLVLIAVLPALVFPPYQPLATTGNYEVAVAQYTFTDQSRIEQYSSTAKSREVHLSFWYPEDAGAGETFPLVIFSHGGLGAITSNESLYLELASHGYVVGAIGHPYHAFWTKSPDGDLTFVNMDYFQEILQEDARRDRLQSYNSYQKWMNIRMGDINFVLDTVLESAANGFAGAYRLIDVERIGVMGHSLGGSAALGIARQRSDIRAVIALESPFLYDIVGVENGEFVFIDVAYPAPVLNIYSDSAWEHLADWPQYARNQALLSGRETTAFNVYLSGAGHFSLTDLSLASPLLVRALEGKKPVKNYRAYLTAVNEVCLKFFNWALKDQAGLTGYSSDQ